MATSTASILFEGEEIVVHHHPGAATFLLVTFIGAFHEATATKDYLLRDFAERYEIPCLGVTTKQRNFFVSDEIDDAIETASRSLRRYQTVILVGWSMGGYACIKYAAKFGATHVLAMAPRYSLDPEEAMPGEDNAFMRRLLPRTMKAYEIPELDRFRGMAPTPADYSGQVYVLFDPQDLIDKYDARRHALRSPRVESIPMFHCGHGVAMRLSRPEVMSCVIHAMRSDDPAIVRRQLYDFKRTQPESILDLLSRSANRHPLLSLRAMLSDRVRANRYMALMLADPINIDIVDGLIRLGFLLQAYRHLNRHLSSLLKRAVEAAPSALRDAEIGDDHPRLLVRAGCGFVGYDIGRGRVVVDRNVLVDDGMLPVLARFSGDDVTLHIRRDGVEEPVALPTDSGTGLCRVVVGHQIALRAPVGFAGPHAGRLEVSADEPDAPILFSPIPIVGEAVLGKARALGWFDQIQASLPEPASLPAARRPLWKRLFN